MSEKFKEQAVDELLSQNAILYERELEMLTNSQIGFLKAVAAGEEKLSSAEVVTKYRLSSSANVSRLKKALYRMFKYSWLLVFLAINSWL